jgi:hypothetical protein
MVNMAHTKPGEFFEQREEEIDLGAEELQRKYKERGHFISFEQTQNIMRNDPLRPLPQIEDED